MFRVALFVTAALVASASCSGEFSVLSSPASLEFKGEDRLDATLIPDVVLSSLGHAIESQDTWNGLIIRNPFKLPRTAVVFVVDGAQTVKSDAIKGHTYPVAGNEHSLAALAERFPDSLTIDLENNSEAVSVISEAFGEVKPVPKKITASGLKPSVNAEDREFLAKLATIEALAKKLQSSKALEKSHPSLILVHLSLASLRAAHQDTPVANAEAADLLAQQLGQFVDAAQEHFGESVLIATVATEHANRQRRDTAEARQTAPVDDINLAKEYNENYPVIFNIILWFGVVMFFSLLAICIAIGDMDPGRDSIIYRMTSTRIKKDN